MSTQMQSGVSRRHMLAGSIGALGTMALAAQPRTAYAAEASSGRPAIQVGIVTDLHYADAPTRGSRHYRQSLPKLERALATFVERDVDAIVQLGDYVDGHDSTAADERSARAVTELFHRTNRPYYLLVGNHCLQNFSKQYFARVTGTCTEHYLFDLGPLRFIVMDPNYREDGVAYDSANFEWTDCFIPDHQLAWLGDALAATDRPTIVLTHQRLDDKRPYCVVNHQAVRDVIADAGGSNVKAVLQGHSHHNERVTDRQIPYIVMRAVVEGGNIERDNGYGILKAYDDGRIEIEGFADQTSYRIA